MTGRPKDANAPDTRERLVRAALELFGARGYDGASTRDIAAKAGVNIAGIAYHFGGKDGLRDACARWIVASIREAVGPALEEGPLPPPDAAETVLSAIVERMVGFLVAQPEAGHVAQFVLREMQQPTAALDLIYAGVFEPVHRRLCAIWAAATGEDAESPAVRIAVFSMIGQVVYFRIGREAVMRRMGWDRVTQAETAAIVAEIRRNLRAAIESRRGEAR